MAALAFARWITVPSRHVGVHCLCISAFCTGLAMCATAGDLGPFAAPLIAIGLYAMFFAAAAEILLAVRYGLAKLGRRFLS